jgi:LDH2 family malate/lactate/ureidoglycolate dehydrogenase
MASGFDERDIALAELTQIALQCRKRIKSAHGSMVKALQDLDALPANASLLARVQALSQLANVASAGLQELQTAIAEVNKASTNPGYAEILKDIDDAFTATPADAIAASHKARKTGIINIGTAIRQAAQAALTAANQHDPASNATVSSRINNLGLSLRSSLENMRDAIAPHVPRTPGG